MVPAKKLQSLSFFDELSDVMLGRLATMAELKTYGEGEYLNKRKKNADYFFVVLEGEISLETESLTGDTVQLETIGPGGGMGFSALIERGAKEYTSDAKALTPVEILRFHANDLTLLFYQDFELGYLFMKKIAQVVKKRLTYRTYPIAKL